MPVFSRISLIFLEDLINFLLLLLKTWFLPPSPWLFLEEESNVSFPLEWFLPAFSAFLSFFPTWLLAENWAWCHCQAGFSISPEGHFKLLLNSKLSMDKAAHFCLNELKLEWSMIFWNHCQNSLIKCGPSVLFFLFNSSVVYETWSQCVKQCAWDRFHKRHYFWPMSQPLFCPELHLPSLGLTASWVATYFFPNPELRSLRVTCSDSHSHLWASSSYFHLPAIRRDGRKGITIPL